MRENISANISFKIHISTYLNIFAVLPSNSGMASSGAVVGYITGIWNTIVNSVIIIYSYKSINQTFFSSKLPLFLQMNQYNNMRYNFIMPIM